MLHEFNPNAEMTDTYASRRIFNKEDVTTDPIEINEIRTEILDDDVTIHHLEVSDQYKNKNFYRIGAELREVTDMGFYGDTSIDLDRKRKSSIDKNNPSTRVLLERYPTFGYWLDTVPKAEALDIIYSPDLDSLPNGQHITPEVREWFRNIADGIGIRSRKAVMKDIIKDEIEKKQDRQCQWASLACGVAQPVFESMRELKQSGINPPRAVLVDYDPTALRLAKYYADKEDMKEFVTTKRANILAQSGISHKPQEGFYQDVLANMKGKLPYEGFDMVDAVGILEYLRREDWQYSYNGVFKKSEKEMAGACSFLKNAYELVKPGGKLVTGNMRDTHPELGFTTNVIQWPHIQPRSIETMLEIIQQAGLEGKIDVYCPSDNVYAIYTIQKPNN